MKRRFAFFAILCAPAAGVVACVGDDTVGPPNPPATDSGAADSTVATDAMTADGSVGVDAADVSAPDAADANAPDALDAADALACTLTVDDASVEGTLCTGVCTNLASDPANCGACSDVCEAGALCSSSTCANIAGSLEGLEWLLPCSSAASGGVCSASNPPDQSAILNGASNATYAVTLHFQGIVEQKTYAPNPYDAGPDAGDAGPAYPVAAGTNASMFIENATPAGDGFNVYELDVSAPAQTIYLNAGTSNIYYLFPLDYVVTIPITGGATVTLSANTIDGSEISNQGIDGGAIGVPGFFDGGAYDGQFIQMDVVSVSPE